MVIPKNMSGAGFESTITVSLHLPYFDIHCVTCVSHDKKLFAVIQSRETLYLLNGSCHPIFGPVQLGMYAKYISHLEFSPDDKFVFFGRLDRWFSVLEKGVVEMSQFSGNSLSYKWGSFICDGKYIAVNRQPTFWDPQIGALLIRWAKYEIIECTPKNVELEVLLSEFDPFFPSSFKLPTLDSFEINIRDSVICHYAKIFENQIWNVQTGTPVLQEMFVSQLGPFFYFWHMYCKMVKYPFELCEESMTLPHVALLNVWMFLAGYLNVYHRRCNVFLEDLFTWEMFEKSRQENVTFTRLTDSINILFSRPVPIDFLYSIAKIGGECYSFVSYGNEVFSKDGKWLLRRDHAGEIGLYEREDKNSSTNRSHLLTDAEDCVFTNDDKVLVYRTTFKNPNLYAINLVSQTTLRSISGTYPVYCSSGEGQDLGFIFSSNNESMTVLLRNLPSKFLRFVSVYGMTAKAVTFTSRDLFRLLFSNGIVDSWQIADGSLVPLGWPWFPSKLNLFQSETIGAKKFLFSHRGGSSVVDQGGRILFFNVEKSSVSAIKEGIKDSVACLTFSADDSLILFCIEEPDVDQCFYIWDVNTSTLSSPIGLNPSVGFEKHVDCCCFSSDSKKLFFL